MNDGHIDEGICVSVGLEFVKGHCGWDVVTLIPEGQLPAGQELSSALKIVSAPLDGGLEVGFLGRGDRPNEIRLRMVSSTLRDWIPMCGGMTQVIGKALVETSLCGRLGIDTSQPAITVQLLTPSGLIPVQVKIQGGLALSVTTVMDNYVALLYGEGIENLYLRGTPLLRVGTYAVLEVTALEQRHPGIDFTRRDPGPHLDIVNEILRAFRKHLGLSGVNGMLYDDRPEGPGQYRVFPRFYSDDMAAARIPWEFQCGTGGIAVAIALAHEQKLQFPNSVGNVVVEWGSYRATPDPYGIRTSVLDLEVKDARIMKAAFSHSVIEILAEGKLVLPHY